MLITLCSVAVALAPPTVPRGASRAWSAEEDRALISAASSFTVGVDANRRTFWDEVHLCTPLLRSRQTDELHERAEQLHARVGDRPIVLRSAERLEDGRWRGEVDGRTVWLNVATEVHPADDDLRALPAYLEVRGGAIFQVARRHERADDETQQYEGSWRALQEQLPQAASAVQSSCSTAIAQHDWDGTFETLYMRFVAATGLLIGGELLVLGLSA